MFDILEELFGHTTANVFLVALNTLLLQFGQMFLLIMETGKFLLLSFFLTAYISLFISNKLSKFILLSTHLCEFFLLHNFHASKFKSLTAKDT